MKIDYLKCLLDVGLYIGLASEPNQIRKFFDHMSSSCN